MAVKSLSGEKINRMRQSNSNAWHRNKLPEGEGDGHYGR